MAAAAAAASSTAVDSMGMGTEAWESHIIWKCTLRTCNTGKVGIKIYSLFLGTEKKKQRIKILF